MSAWLNEAQKLRGTKFPWVLLLYLLLICQKVIKLKWILNNSSLCEYKLYLSIHCKSNFQDNHACNVGQGKKEQICEVGIAEYVWVVVLDHRRGGQFFTYTISKDRVNSTEIGITISKKQVSFNFL